MTQNREESWAIRGSTPAWSLTQDIALLDTVEQYGPHSWDEVARILEPILGKVSPQQLEEHFQWVCERLSISSIEPPFTSCPTLNVFPHLTPLDRPPRPPPPLPSSATSAARHLAGYNPARGDFASLPDPTLELLLANLAAPESDLEGELQCTLVRAYNRRLKHRLRKLALVKEHGLLTRRSRLPPPWHRFSNFYCALDLSLLSQGVEAERQLRARVLRLQHLRRCGVTLLAAAPLFKTLEKRRGEHAAALKEEEGGRKGLLPLDIVGLPEYEKLSEPERTLCTELRLMPSVFAELRAKLEVESTLRGGLMLAEAREALRIDVNKTRVETHHLHPSIVVEKESNEDEVRQK